VEKLSNFNIEMKVADGGVWWENVKEKKGWKLQRNYVSGHYRIISPSKIRKAWGPDRDEMVDIFNELTEDRDPVYERPATQQQQSPPPEKPSKQEILAQLKDLGDLYADGVLTKDEFEAAKKKLLKEL
jgi:bifunctional DNA-binding transcriptional regulator/antitoxin component of YhaV-PrlF toxin-antitoxin module